MKTTTGNSRQGIVRSELWLPSPVRAFTQSASGLAQSKTCRRAFMLLAVLASCVCATAQSYSVDWAKVSGGGGLSTGGVYVISGTIGQHDSSGPMTGGGYSVTGGYWSLLSLVQTPGAPALSLNRAGNTVTVYWQNTAGWSLYQNTSVAAPAAWTLSGGVTTTNGTNYLQLTAPSGRLFFRLSSGP